MAALSNLKELDLEVDVSDSRRVGTSAVPNLLSREHVKFVARSLRRLGVRESEVDDAVQEVFVIASRKVDTIAEGSERSFLYGTAIRVASNARRIERRALTRRAETKIASEQDGIDTGPNAEQLLARRAARAALDTILEKMTVEMRVAFTLFELEEMTIAEIAALLEVPMGTVSSRLRRARELFEQQVAAMKVELEREGRSR
ncbi:MAG: polymerase sigma factor RpoE [Labilithrix sp.]|nr:polymerase sigma factor RpoE [Labilithrix sp.]